ncbi:MAG: OadG family protein [Lachnospiraceae bacterium]|nr:OadG family protein [Lachnospiraceae bacterium]
MTYGEILVKALTNTALGMGTVFLSLIFIACIIAMLPKVTGAFESIGKRKKEETKAAETAPAEETQLQKIIPEEEGMDDLELVAVITAAIAAMEGIPADGFVVRSIKRSSQNKWRRV